MKIASTPLTLEFHKASDEFAAKTGCTGFLTTKSVLTATQIDLIKKSWQRDYKGEPRDGEKIVFLEES